MEEAAILAKCMAAIADGDTYVPLQRVYRTQSRFPMSWTERLRRTTLYP